MKNEVSSDWTTVPFKNTMKRRKRKNLNNSSKSYSEVLRAELVATEELGKEPKRLNKEANRTKQLPNRANGVTLQNDSKLIGGSRSEDLKQFNSKRSNDSRLEFLQK